MPDHLQLQNARMTWRGDELLANVRREVLKRFLIILEMVKTQVQRNLSTGNPPRSSPGAFPHADSGRLRQSIFTNYSYEGGKLSGIVGTPLAYGVLL